MPGPGSAIHDTVLPSLRPLRWDGDEQKELGKRGWRVEGGERDGIWGDNKEEEDGSRGKGTPRVGRKEGTPGSAVPRRTGI